MLALQTLINTLIIILAVVVLVLPVSNVALLTATTKQNKMSGRPRNERC